MAVDLVEMTGRARVMLRDERRFFSIALTGTGSTAAYKLPVMNVDSTGLSVNVNATQLTAADYELIARDGYLRFDTPPTQGDTIMVEGYRWTWITEDDLGLFVRMAIDQYIISETLGDEGDFVDLLESNTDVRNVVAIAGMVEALFAEVTAAAREIDVSSPEVQIPARQRFEQLMRLLEFWMGELRRREEALNVGRYKIEMFTLRRISRTTNRYVPLYRGQEFDDLDYPAERILPPIPDGMT